MLVNTFVISNFNNFFLVWNISSTQSLRKIEDLQKRALRFLLNDYDRKYEICEKRQRILCLEIYKTSNKLNPGFMNDIFKL